MSSSIGRIYLSISYSKALVGALLIGGVYFKGFYDDGSKLESQIKKKHQGISAEQKKKVETDKVLAEEAAIKSEVGALAENFKAITERFPVNLKSDELVATINALAEKVNVRVTSVKKETNNVKDLYEEVPVSIELTGSFNNLVLFMYNVSSLERVTNFGDFKFKNLKNNYDGTIKLETTVIGYKYKTPEPAQVEDDMANAKGKGRAKNKDKKVKKAPSKPKGGKT